MLQYKKFPNKLSSLKKTHKLFILFLMDFLLAFISWFVFGPPLTTSIATSLDISPFQFAIENWLQFMVPCFLAIFLLFLLGFYKTLIRFFDPVDSILVTSVSSILFGMAWIFIYVYLNPITSEFLFVIVLQGAVLSVMFLTLINLSRVVAKYYLKPMDSASDAAPIIIYGAGAAGQELSQAILMDKSKKLIAFYDDSKNLKDRSKNGIPIYGSLDNLKKLKKIHQNLEVLLAIPSLDLIKRRKVISKLEDLKISVRTVPALHELIFDSKKMSDIQNLSINDILPGRRVEKYIVNKASEREFFISGAGGSIGAELSRQILSQNPSKIILFDISEFNLFNIFEELKLVLEKNNFQTSLIPILGSVCDQNHLNHIFINYNIDTVYHAAAYKHVPLVEDENNIAKSIENNLLGTYLLAKSAINAKIKSFVLVSTDKAVRPTNIMGASKRMAEISIQALNQSQNDTDLCMVRFGNVINSSGSVIPLFLEQISRGGPVTITHKNVERYFMTIPEASSLVIQAGEMSKGGEVFLLDMGEQIKIMELAKKLIHLSGRNIANDPNESGIEIVEVGLRPGEKMYEELLISGTSQKTLNNKIFKSNESFIPLKDFSEIIEDVKIFIKDNNIKNLKSIMSRYVDGFSA